MVVVRVHLQVSIKVSKFPLECFLIISNHLSTSDMLPNNPIHAQDHSKITFDILILIEKTIVLTRFNFFIDQPSGMICFNTSPSGGFISIKKGNFTLRKNMNSKDNFRVSSCLRRAYKRYKYWPCRLKDS